MDNFKYQIIEKSTDKVLIITAGGTIDKVYDFLGGGLKVGRTVVGEILSSSKYVKQYEIVELFKKDSLEINDIDRGLILDMINKSESNFILVTHGTDKMYDSAEIVSKYGVNIANKIIIFTGAIIPYSMPNSDASFNVGVSLVSFEALCPGVYISMHGRVLPYNKYKKNKELGVFEIIDME